MYYYLILALQVYCAYHCYVSRNNYYWFFAILFLPVLGSLLYLFMNVVQKRDVDKMQAGIVSVINPTKKITDLEKKFKFAETYENQVKLADAYLDARHYDKAVENYEASLKDVFQNDFHTISKLEEAYYFSSQFDKVIECAERIMTDQKFKKSKAAFLYALALEKQGDATTAEEYLQTFDAPYSRYKERIELAKFFIRNDKQDHASELLQEIVTESEGMSKPSYRQNRLLINKAKELLANEL